MKYIRFIIYLFAAIIFCCCANEVALTGGPKDTTPPVLVEDKPANFSTNFNSGEVVLEFDEYISLKNINQKMIISPPFKEDPTITQKGKKVIIKLKEPVKPNTTYCFNFNDAIVDYNESNPLKNFSYIVSTGTYIDSLAFSGIIKDAFTLKPIENALVALYLDLSDTAFKTTRPYYIAKTDKEGKYSFAHLKDTVFNIFALVDQNNSMTYDLITEGIAFIDSSFCIRDSLMKIDLLCFTETDTIQKIIEKKILQSNTTRLIFKFPPKEPRIEFYNEVPDIQEMSFSKFKDTITIQTTGIDTAFMVVYDGSRYIDSLRLIVNNERLASKSKLTFTSGFQAKTYYKSNLFIKSNNILDSLIIDSIMTVSSIDTISDTSYCKLKYADSSKMSLCIDATLQPLYKYQFSLPDSAAKDIFGLYSGKFSGLTTITDENEYGNVIINVIAGQDSVIGITGCSNFIVALYNKDKAIMERAIDMTASDSVQVKFPLLSPKEYSIVIIYDKNGDREWTTGDYATRRQPEKVEYPKTITVKSKWDIEERIQVIK